MTEHEQRLLDFIADYVEVHLEVELRQFMMAGDTRRIEKAEERYQTFRLVRAMIEDERMEGIDPDGPDPRDHHAGPHRWGKKGCILPGCGVRYPG